MIKTPNQPSNRSSGLVYCLILALSNGWSKASINAFYLCSNHRLIIYSYLIQCLKDGSLAKTAKLDIMDTWLNRKSCEFTEFSYWKIDRTSFYTDVPVTLYLKTGRRTVTWQGIVTVWCSFDEEEEAGKEEVGS